MTEPEQLHPPQDEASREPKVIKRYTNRKLYDTVESRYVTLDEIAEMVKQGVEVKIVDNRTKEDLTSVTLAQIVFEEEKKKSQMPLDVLREIIRRPGDVAHRLHPERGQPPRRLASAKRPRRASTSCCAAKEGARAPATAETAHGPRLPSCSRPQRTLEDWQRRSTSG